MSLAKLIDWDGIIISNGMVLRYIKAEVMPKEILTP